MTAEVKRIILLVALPCLVAVYVLMFQVRDQQIAQCNRGNIQRVSLYRFERSAAQTRQRAADKGGPTADIDQAAADQYNQLADNIVRAYADVAAVPGGVVIDCGAAYERPFPFNL